MNEFGYEFRVLAFLWITHDPEHDARVDCDSDIIPCFAALDWRIENHELLRDKLRNLDEWAFEVKPSFPHPGTRTCLQLFSIVCPVLHWFRGEAPSLPRLSVEVACGGPPSRRRPHSKPNSQSKVCNLESTR